MPWRVLSFAFGLWMLQQLAVLPAPTFLAGLGCGGAVLLVGGWRRFRYLAVIGAGLLGFAWAGGFAHLRLADALPSAWERQDVEVTGVVAELPQRFERGVRFVFDVEHAAAPVPSRVVISWYRQGTPLAEEEGEEYVANGALPWPRAGERWRFVVRLKRPHGNVNPHGFDYEGWLLERGIRATGHVRKAPQNARLDVQAGGLAGAVERLREATRQRIDRQLPDMAYAGILKALAVGDQHAIAPELWRLFAASGITHLMSISGLHVTMVGALVAWLANFLWRRSARLPLLWPAQHAAALAGFGGAFAYALIAGFGVPAQRTLYMLGVVVLAMLSGRNLAARQVLGSALLLVLLVDSWAVLAPGFWLSFGAVALLFFIGSGSGVAPRRAVAWMAEWGRAQWAMTLGLMPVLLALFQQFSLVSPVANAIAIPLVSFAVTPLALLGAVPGFGWVLPIAHAVLVPLMAFIGWLAGLPGALWQQHAPPVWALVFACLGTLWLLLPRGFPNRWLGLFAFLPLFFIHPERPVAGAVRVTVLDVGQGQAVHVQTAQHDLLYDTGPDFAGLADAGNRIILPYLRATGVRQLDRLVVSHGDRDHAGGMASILAGLPVRDLLTSLEKSAPTGRRCSDGEQWEWDGVRFRMLHPAAADYAAKRSTNAMSCVLKIESRHGAVLIPGDVEGSAEAALLARHGETLQADVLVAPHHGGKRTASPAFVAAVDAREVVFPVGYLNRFGHPVLEVVERFAATGAAIHRTDHAGAVIVHLDGRQTAPIYWRDVAARYWNAK